MASAPQCIAVGSNTGSLYCFDRTSHQSQKLISVLNLQVPAPFFRSVCLFVCLFDVCLAQHQGFPFCFAFSETSLFGRFFVSGFVLVFQQGHISAISFSSDGGHLVAGTK